MADAQNEGEELGFGVPFSIEAAIAFQQRLKSDPDSVSDEEIWNEFGGDTPPHEIRELFRGGKFGNTSKTPRASARSKLRRRLLWLGQALADVEAAVAEVRAAPGRTNKQAELDEVLAAIEVFRSTVKLPAPPEPTELDPDFFERVFGAVSDNSWMSGIGLDDQDNQPPES